MINNQKTIYAPGRGLRTLCIALLWLLALLPTVSWAAIQQANATYTFALDNVAFGKAVSEIEGKTNYSFVYDTHLVGNNTRVKVNANNATIDEVVEQLVNGLPLTYEIKYGRVFINKQNNNQGKHTVTGRITDTNGEPLIGASVSVVGTDAVTITDIDGNYSISAPAGNVKFKVFYVGFEPKTVLLRGRNKLDVVLMSDTQLLGDVVVLGYGTQKKESLTSAISTVGAEDISRSSATNTSGALVGKVAGINSRMSDGRPGATTTLNIRNMGTPLYVVDGVQMDEGQFNNIDFNDIESISVLKDGSAAIYGVRAANGVVVVKTKSGHRNTPNQINLNMYYGWQSMFRFPRPASAADWIEAQVQSATITGATGKYSYEDLQKWRQGTEKGYQGFDWYDYIFTTSPQSYISLNTSGGSENINYYFALSHIDQQSIINNYGGYNRSNIQFNVDAYIRKNFKVGVSVNGRIEKTTHPAISGNDGNDDYWTAFFSTYRNFPTSRPFANDNPDYPAQTSTAPYTNFALFGKTGEQFDRWKVLQTNLTLEYEIIKNLKLSGIFSYFYANRRYDNFEKSYKLYAYNENTDTYSPVVTVDGRYKDRDIKNNEVLNGQLNLSYETTIAKDHKVSAFIGSEVYKSMYPGMSLSSNPKSNALKFYYFDDLKSINDYNSEEARAGFMGRFNYEYKSRYLFEFSARYDGSWKFPPSHRWGFFPSFSGAWRISEESFWNDNLKEIVSNFKLRASYGILGDDNVGGYGAFGFMPGYNYGNGGAILDGEWVVGSGARSLPVTNISWIKAKILDIGVDLGFFNNRLTATFDLFRRLRTGLPASRYDKVLPSEVGFGLPSENLNSDVVKGIDGSIGWDDNIADFKYHVGGNFTLARAYNWHQYKPRFKNSRDKYVYSSNERVSGASWTLECIGQFQSWEQIANWPVDIDGKGNSTIRPGDLIYKDVNGDGTITDDDQMPQGYFGYDNTNTPILSFGINLSASWKGIDFSCDFSGAALSTHFFNYESRVPFWGDANSPAYMFKDQWHLSDINDPNSELIPGKYPTALLGNSTHSNYKASTFWMENVAYLKLRNLELGYTFPISWTQKVAIQKLRVYTLMQNLFSLDNVHDRGIDPEIYQSAGFVSPTNRIMNIGLSVTF